jgi:tRNA threonylcarbamoyladenosine biosynthesis protein TsaE
MPTDDNGRAFTLHLADEAATLALGAALAAELKRGMTVFLAGPLGAGKTTLARGLIRALGFEGRVKSPSYSLVELYVVSGLYLYHFDFYRFIEPREFRDAGLGEYFNEQSLCVVEWPEKARDQLPVPDLRVTLEMNDAGGRTARLESSTESGQRCVNALQRRL